jgi:hypothetical protein
MERFILWLAKIFKVNLAKTEYVKEVVTEVKYLTNGTIKGDVCIDGNLLIDGDLKVSGGITLYKKK